jgi:hypothetical protein
VPTPEKNDSHVVELKPPSQGGSVKRGASNRARHVTKGAQLCNELFDLIAASASRLGDKETGRRVNNRRNPDTIDQGAQNIGKTPVTEANTLEDRGN